MFESVKNARQPRKWPVRRILISAGVIAAVLGIRTLSRGYEKRKLDQLNAHLGWDRGTSSGRSLDPPAVTAPPERARERSDETATARATAMTPVQLPGMSVEMPEPREVAGDYRVGEVRSADAKLFAVDVTWRPGGLPSEDQFEADLRARSAEWVDLRSPPGSSFPPIVDRSDRARELRLDGSEVRQGIIRAPRFSFYLLVGTCGGRRVELYSASPEITERLRASFRCHPAPAQDQAVRDAPVRLAVAERAGWHRIAPRSGLVLAGAEHVSVRLYELPTGTDVEFEARLGRLGLERGYDLRRRANSTGDHVVWNAEPSWGDDPGGTSAVVVWRCPAIGMAGVAWISPEAGGTNLKSGIELAMTGRCLAEGEPYPAHLAAPGEDAAPPSRARGH